MCGIKITLWQGSGSKCMIVKQNASLTEQKLETKQTNNEHITSKQIKLPITSTLRSHLESTTND